MPAFSSWPRRSPRLSLAHTTTRSGWSAMIASTLGLRPPPDERNGGERAVAVVLGAADEAIARAECDDGLGDAGNEGDDAAGRERRAAPRARRHRSARWRAAGRGSSWSPPWQAASSSSRTENKTPTRSGSWNEGVQHWRSSPVRRRRPPPRPSLERHDAGAGGPVSWLEAVSPAFPGSRPSPVASRWRHRTADRLAGLIQWRGRAGLVPASL